MPIISIQINRGGRRNSFSVGQPTHPPKPGRPNRPVIASISLEAKLDASDPEFGKQYYVGRDASGNFLFSADPEDGDGNVVVVPTVVP